MEILNNIEEKICKTRLPNVSFQLFAYLLCGLKKEVYICNRICET